MNTGARALIPLSLCVIGACAFFSGIIASLAYLISECAKMAAQAMAATTTISSVELRARLAFLERSFSGRPVSKVPYRLCPDARAPFGRM